MSEQSQLAECAVIVAVLPEYREHFLHGVRRRIGEPGVDFFAGSEHLVTTVTSGSSSELGIGLLRNRAIAGRRLLWQHGALAAARGRRTVVTDLNPRSLSAWALLVLGRIRGQRVLVWGHILPRKGAAARTVPLRRFMRRLAAGVISYTWRDSAIVRKEDPDVPVWVAANGIYPSDWLGSEGDESARDRLLYVGRLVREKKPELLLIAYSQFLSEWEGQGQPPRLTIVGDGPERPYLERRARDLRIDSRVDFLGHVGDYDALRGLYSRTVASVSPGYAGLSLTQSLGFGVPMIVADDEPHAPEIELLSEVTGVTFHADSPSALAAAIDSVNSQRESWAKRRNQLVETVRRSYSADAMADGFTAAIQSSRSAVQGAAHV
ncbi:hypothetical protein AVP42_02113 [Agromyces sp. NDB4Y10]|uniref:glycosyltransferase family 4 protein n=1 Tax=Agromyces sp. NDB4Y10 TaxID=1775951 RepID=UPI0007B2F442|nr:glycosyltransferase [Agromyces sp. NDB4Y10]KZE92847.1 hypothetical protein AVP42_02113 [Agromyces sp. NDB4Y10]